MQRKKYLTILVITLALLQSVSSFAQLSSNNIRWDKMNMTDGLQTNSISRIYEDKFGFMWFTSAEGIDRYDGYTFIHFHLNYPGPNLMLNEDVLDFFEDSDSVLWMTTREGLIRYNRDSANFTRFADPLRTVNAWGYFHRNYLRAITATDDSTLWLGSEYGLTRFNKLTHHFSYYYNADSSQSNFIDKQWVYDLLADGNKGVWISSLHTLNYFDVAKKKFTTYAPVDSSVWEGTYWGLEQMVFAGKNEIWLSDYDHGGVTIFNIETKSFSFLKETLHGEDAITGVGTRMAKDAEGNIWISGGAGAFSSEKGKCGLLKIDVAHLTVTKFFHDDENPNSILSNYCSDVCCDRTGRIWTATEKGICSYDPGKYQFEQLKIEDKNVVEKLKDVYQMVYANDSEVLLTITPLGLCVLKLADGKLTTGLCGQEVMKKNYQLLFYKASPTEFFYSGFDEKPNYNIYNRITRRIKTISADPVYEAVKSSKFYATTFFSGGRLWLNSVDSGMVSFDINTNEAKVHALSIPDDWQPFGIFEAPDGKVWMSILSATKQGKPVPGGLIEADLLKNTYVFHEDTSKDKTSPRFIGGGISQDRNGNLWLISSKGIWIYYVKTQQYKKAVFKNGFDGKGIFGVINDRLPNGNMWIVLEKGIIKVNPDNFECTTYDLHDGLPETGLDTKYVLAEDGRLFLATMEGIFSFYPKDIKQNKNIPPIIITSFAIGDSIVKPNSYWENNTEIKLPYYQSTLSFEFAALDYRNPSKNQYAYYMENLENKWNYSGTRRNATYNKLAPGEYLLHIKGSNNDGVWNEQGITFHIIITPPWWQTWWARSLYVIALIAGVFLFIRIRTQTLTRQKKVLEEKVEVRTEELRKEKDKSEELLLNILPSEVAEELKEKGSADAKQFDDVTVMFTDFKNFTQISEKLSPTELVNEIHTCFKAFDDIIGKHNIEKIKTIGDSYMCAGGLPVANKTNAEDLVSAAIEIQNFMQQHLLQRKDLGKEIFEIRIGIHTGPVVAGIVGVKKFAYDIWGDTVNIASRMESSGEAGKINISGSTYELVKDKFNCLHRGKIQAKNKGEIDMYFVEN